jgi:hypothetical protein
MKPSSYRAFARVIGCVLTLFWIVGCGSGGNSAGSGGGGGSSSGGGGGGGSSSGGGGTSDTRSVLFDSIATKFAGFDGSNPDNENQQMLTLLHSKSDFVDSGLSPSGGVWGRFADGTTLVIANNVSRTPTRDPLPSRSIQAAHTRAAGFPTTDKVILGESIGSFWAGFLSETEPWFVDQNYTIQTPAATVDALKSFSNVGLLFLATHGTACPIRQGGPNVYIVWTETLRAADGSTDKTYAADLKDGSLTYFMGLTFQGDSAQIKVETHYGLTSKFVTKYWSGKFNPNSLVFVDACSSASPNALEFEMACLNAGASLYLGWSDSVVIRDGLVTATYLFDRMLGANQFPDEEKPPQRAFSWSSVMSDMHTRKRTYTDTNYDQSLNLKTGITANLLALGLNANFAQLAPSIESLTIDEQKDELTVNGTFGDPQGDVYINDNPLTVKSWSGTQIVCAIPRTGASSSGDVTVRAGAPRQLSNTVQLTEWNGTVRCTQKGKGTLQLVMNFNLHFRADVHDRRIIAHQTPFMPGANYLNALDTSGTFETSGTYVTPDLTYSESWSGSGTIPAYVKPADATAVSNVVLQGSFDKDRKWSMAVNALAKSGNHVHVITKNTANGPVTSDTTVTQDIGWTSTGDLNGGLSLLTAGLDYSIAAGSVTNTINPDQPMTLEWSAMTPNHPPASDAARSAKPLTTK